MTGILKALEVMGIAMAMLLISYLAEVVRDKMKRR